MMLYLYLEVDLSDDDADLDEVARDCGHTLSHPQLSDWDLVRCNQLAWSCLSGVSTADERGH